MFTDINRLCVEFLQGYMDTRYSQHLTLHLLPLERGLKRTKNMYVPPSPFSSLLLFFLRLCYFFFFCLGGFDHLLYLLVPRGYMLRGSLPSLLPSLFHYSPSPNTRPSTRREKGRGQSGRRKGNKWRCSGRREDKSSARS